SFLQELFKKAGTDLGLVLEQPFNLIIEGCFFS
ncbi:MAG: hypothetical protein ACI97K_003472, partial [Glaciecola sp.]